jgi:hypothetical protein
MPGTWPFYEEDVTGASMCSHPPYIASVLNRSRFLRTQPKRTNMTGANRRKMTAIGGEHFGSVQSLCCRNHRCIHKTEIEISIFSHESLGSSDILRLEGFNNELAVRYRPHESAFGLLGDSRMEEIADLRQHTHGNYHRLAVLAPPSYNPLVPRVVAVDQRVEGTRVGDYSHAWGSCQSSLSTRPEVFFFPLENLPVTDGRGAAAVGCERYLEMASRTTDATLTCRRSAARFRSRRMFASRKRLVRFMTYILPAYMPVRKRTLSLQRNLVCSCR